METDTTKIETRMFENWELYLNLVNKISDQETKTCLTKLCEELSERFIVCPASTKTGYIGAFVGGLIWNNLNVLKTMKEMNKIHGSTCSADEMIVTSLFYDIGKLGDKKEDYYLAQKSDWHRDRGILFEVNPKLSNTPIVARSIWWLNQYKVPMTESVVEALFSLYSSSISNKPSDIYQVSNLGLLLQQSVRSTCVLNGKKTSILE